VCIAGVAAATIRAYVDSGYCFPWPLAILGVIYTGPYFALAFSCWLAYTGINRLPGAGPGSTVHPSNWLRALFLAAAAGRNLVHCCYIWSPALIPPNMAGMVRSGVDVSLDGASALIELVGLPWLVVVQIGCALVQWQLFGVLGMRAPYAVLRAVGKGVFNTFCAAAVDTCWRRAFLLRTFRSGSNPQA
jgi:hypothetical protein